MWNQQLSREEYNQKLSKINLKSYKEIEKLKEKYKELYSKSIHQFINQTKVVNSTGDNLDGVKNCKFCFDATGIRIEDSKYIHWIAHLAKDVYDSGPGVGEAELVYEAFDTGIGNYRNLFTSVVYSSRDIEYSFNCHGCDNLFGCLGLRSKKYCILNKQYNKESFEKLRTKIIEQMNNMPYVDKNGIVYKYGEFFPAEISTFCYNETQAQDYFPITKKEAIKKGYRWRDKQKNKYQTTVSAEDLPDNLDDVPDSIIKEKIECLNIGKTESRCLSAYKITENELKLYHKIGVPLPHLCFNCRHEARLKKRNPMKLWHRKCMKEGCQNEFETSYAPDRPEIVYCEKCYQQEVY